MPMTSAAPSVVLVLGMHRSGTSATAGALRLLGVPLGERMVPAAADNPSGYWEHAQIVDIHERLLRDVRRTWEDVRPLPSGWVDSEPAARAEADLAALIQREFRAAPLWGAKDPRMMRLLPLWCRLLDRLGIRATFLFVVRDPEEVAASLAARDGMSTGHARLLWLQHLIESETATRQRPRAMIEYRCLLADPERTLHEAGVALGIDWPIPPSVCRDALIAFLDTGQRHHDRGRVAIPSGMLAREAHAVYAVCERISRGEPMWTQLAGQQAEVDAAVAAADWCAGLADALCRSREGSAALDARLVATDRALRDVTAQSLARLEQMQALEARVQETDRALREVTTQSLARLEQMHTLEARVQETDQALREVTTQSLARLEEMHTLEARVQETDLALREVTTQSLARLEQMHALEARVQKTDLALREVTAQSLSRLQLVHTLEARVQETDSALHDAAALSLARLAQLHALEARVQATDQALHEATELALARLAQVQALEARVQATDQALHEATVQSLARLEQVQALEVRVQRTDHALREATTLSLQRLDELQTQTTQLRAAQAALKRLQVEHEAAAAEARAQRDRSELAEHRIAELLASRSWRYTRPLRVAARAVSRVFGWGRPQ